MLSDFQSIPSLCASSLKHILPTESPLAITFTMRRDDSFWYRKEPNGVARNNKQEKRNRRLRKVQSHS